MIRMLLCMLGQAVGAATIIHCVGADPESALLAFGGIVVISFTCYFYGLTSPYTKEF